MQPGGQPACSPPTHEHITQNVNGRSRKPKPSQTPATSYTSKKNNSSSKKPSPLHQPLLREQKKPLHASNNVKIVNTPPAEAVPEYLKDADKVYAGAKFSEPPSPSVLPKPPSHWVGENEPEQSNQSREQMTVHLKSLLKVQDSSWPRSELQKELVWVALNANKQKIRIDLNWPLTHCNTILGVFIIVVQFPIVQHAAWICEHLGDVALLPELRLIRRERVLPSCRQRRRTKSFSWLNCERARLWTLSVSDGVLRTPPVAARSASCLH